MNKCKVKKKSKYINEKKPINILIEDHKSEPIEPYVNYFKKFFKTNIILFSDIVSVRNSKKSIYSYDIDLVVFTRGETTIHPEFYNEKVGKHICLDTDRDIILNKIYSSYSYLPCIGFGRGGHFLAVKSGAKIIQFVNNYKKNKNSVYLWEQGHPILREDIRVNTQQLIDVTDLPSSLYNILITPQRYQSTSYLNGNNEEITLPLTFLEVLGVKFNKASNICIEAMIETNTTNIGNSYFKNILSNLIKK